MTSYIVAVHLVVEAGATDPRAEIAAQLDAILGQNLGMPSPLLDWAVAGDDLAESIAPVALPVDYRPDESAFPVWPLTSSDSARAHLTKYRGRYR